MFAAILLTAATANAAAVAAPGNEFSSNGVGLGNLLASQDGKSEAGYVSIDDLNLGQDLGVDGKSVYVGKDAQGIQLFQFADGSVAPLTYEPGETEDIPVKNNLCQGCQNTSGHAKRELSIRDLAGSIGGNDSETGGNADFGDIKIGEDVGASVGLEGAKYVGKDDDGVQLFQFPNGDVAPIILSPGAPAEGYTFNERTGLCDGCQDSEGWTRKRSVGEELELAEREAEGGYEIARDLEERGNEERFFLGFLGILGHKVHVGKSVYFGPGRWKCNVAHGGYINIKGCRRGTNIGIRHGRYAGCNPRGVQMFHFPGHGVCPLKCSKGPVRHGWKVDKGGYCNNCHHSGWGGNRNGWWRRDEIVEEGTELATRDASPNPAQHEERFLLGLLGLKLKVGTALFLGKGRVISYLAHGGYVNIPRCRPGTHIGIHGGVYVGCNKNGVQMFKWGHGRVGPLKCRRGPVRKGCKVRKNLCDVCHHDGNYWGNRWGRDVGAEIDELD
ncbi:hypothetical protein CspeluHIS016_0703100 [Cutaneotrichosporon spelunceum]|uniref:Uncharacterized protein n=1 Tax=Cutaneotrichosporon spelunceum TaxID=1672016 RepID=A0AAD3TYN0_9TREE|nr:hypothetical protein CspeluHIS016_0703100 [Cutaneotrichosporon spelunceum]